MSTAEQTLTEIERLRTKRERVSRARRNSYLNLSNRIREMEGVFTVRGVATKLDCSIAQAQVALYHLQRRGEVAQVREAGMGRFAEPSLWQCVEAKVSALRGEHRGQGATQGVLV